MGGRRGEKRGDFKKMYNFRPDYSYLLGELQFLVFKPVVPIAIVFYYDSPRLMHFSTFPFKQGPQLMPLL